MCDVGVCCTGSCSPIATHARVTPRQREANISRAKALVALYQKEKGEQLAREREEQIVWRQASNASKTMELMFSGEYPRLAAGIPGDGRDRSGCASILALAGSGIDTAIDPGQARQVCVTACQSHRDCRYFWMRLHSSDGGNSGDGDCCLKSGPASLADSSQGMITNLPGGEFYRMEIL
jgi:hypothetical protein